MKKSMKQCVCIGLALCMFWAGAGEANAAHGTGCNSQLYKVVCGSHAGYASPGSHEVYVTANGTYTICQRTDEVKFHNIVCTSCGLNLQSNTARTCTRQHTYCPNEYGLCQN